MQNRAGDWQYLTKKLVIPNEGGTSKIKEISTSKVLGLHLSGWELNFEKSIFDYVDKWKFQIAYNFNKSVSEDMKTTILRFTRSKKTSDGFFTLRNQFSGKYLEGFPPDWHETKVNGKYITLWSLHLNLKIFGYQSHKC